MSATEIILIVIGVAVFLLGYLMPARRKDIDEEVQLISEDEVRKLVAGEVEHVKDKIADIVDETVNYSIEKAERAMERVTNEKMMAVNEYSDTVLEEINKNHKEVVFLYDMLNDKHDNLMSSINEATMAADDIKQAVKDAELTATEAADKIDAVLQAADEAADTIRDAENAAVQAQKMAQDTMRYVMNMSMAERRPGVEERFIVETSEIETVEEATAGNGIVENMVWEQKPITVDRSSIIGEPLTEEMPDETEEILDLPERLLMPGEIMPAEEVLPEDTLPERLLMPEEIVSEKDIPEEIMSANVMARAETVPEKGQEETVDFTPISPRRVEIIHQPDGDYVAENIEDMSTSAAFASMGFFTPRAEAAEESGRRPRTRRNSRKDRLQENAAAMDIQFAQGKDNGRNSNERILELHKAGKSNMAIAKELGLGLGEVKLVIDLFEGV
ncbi:MAG: hypothetical protein HDR28_04460 [Lachnospiraceae bacterium]|nr:hypothetical protein [Lachnospiraceae bacterium]